MVTPGSRDARARWRNWPLCAGLLAMVVSGCLSGSRPHSAPLEGLDEAPTQPDYDDATGALAGTVMAADFVPIPGVILVLDPLGLFVLSDDSGWYVFSRIPPGAYDVRTEHPAFEPGNATAKVDPGRVTTLDMTLAERPHEVPHVSLHPFTAYIPCAVGVIQTTTPCQSVGLEQQLSDRFNVARGLTTLVVSARWNPPSVVGSWDGKSRLLFQVGAPNSTQMFSQWLATSPATTQRLELPYEAGSFDALMGDWRVTVRPHSGTDEEAYLDSSGFVYDQRVDVWVTLAFYGHFLVPEYTGLPDA